jgi:hypothetical protein
MLRGRRVPWLNPQRNGKHNPSLWPGMTNPTQRQRARSFPRLEPVTARVARWPAHSVRWQVVRLKPRCSLSINPPPRRSARLISRVENCPPRSSCAAIFPDRGQRERPAVHAHDRQLAALAAPSLKEATGMPDPIIDAVMGRSIHRDAVRTHPLAAWLVAGSDRLLSELVSRRLYRPLQNRRGLEADGFTSPDPDGCTCLRV